MDHLDILAHWVGWADMVAIAAWLVMAGFPPRPGRAPRGVVRLLFHGVGLVICRHDLKPRVCERLHDAGYRIVGRGRWRVALAWPKRCLRRHAAGVNT